MLEWLKESRVGEWEVKNFELSRTDALMSVFSYGHRAAHAGNYTGLFHDKRGVIMSDTPAELRDLYGFEYALSEHPGRVHINGLGLGICTKMALDKGYDVEVVEIDPNVIELVGSQILKLYPHLKIINADCLVYKPSKEDRFAIVWHDIWDTICEDNWPQYNMLHRRYGRKTEWQGSWARYEILRQKRASRSYSLF